MQNKGVRSQLVGKITGHFQDKKTKSFVLPQHNPLNWPRIVIQFFPGSHLLLPRIVL